MRLVTFGEVMLRLAPEELLRLRQVLPGRLESTFGGGELNVAVSAALQGLPAAFATALPDNVLTDALEQDCKKLGVETDRILRCERGRFGIYFVETGANQRGGTVTYDREHSSIALLPAESYDWDAVFRDATWFHITGITPAISAHAAKAALESVRQARTRGLRVSCDLNFRKKLWRWDDATPPIELARRTMSELLQYVDVVIANEEDCDLSLGISAGESDVEAGSLNTAAYEEVARTLVERFPNVSQVAVTLRESLSASHNNWGAMVYDAASGASHFAPTNASGRYEPHEIRNIVDRVGAGDSFAGALIVALNDPMLQAPESAIRYAVAASCLKHSIKGDFNYTTRAEIEALMHGSGSGRVQR
ncbi:MAG: carbohydrate kinase [Planctomycetaceae bacterium]|nr:carbohydrate kinase [Planctomycetaceae bacterium]